MKSRARAYSKQNTQNCRVPILPKFTQDECSDARADRKILLLLKREQMMRNKENLPPSRTLSLSLCEDDSLSSDESLSNSGWCYSLLFLQFIQKFCNLMQLVLYGILIFWTFFYYRILSYF